MILEQETHLCPLCKGEKTHPEFHLNDGDCGACFGFGRVPKSFMDGWDKAKAFLKEKGIEPNEA